MNASAASSTNTLAQHDRRIYVPHALATIMVVVFAAFTPSTDRTIKLIGLGMAAAILVDALVVRTVLVPAIMHTLGRRNWYLPAWLDRRLPHLEIEEGASTRSEDHELALARSV